MIISCPECSASFFVSPQQIGESGRRVKCSKCKHIWHATIETDAGVKEEIIAQRLTEHNEVTGANLPAIIPTKIPKFLYVAPFVLSFLIIATIWFFYPSITSKVAICGPLCSAEGVRIEDAIFDYNKDSGNVTLNFSIANRGKEEVEVPTAKIELIGADSKVMRAAKASGNSMKLPANSSIKVTHVFSAISQKSQFIKISLGNTIKFWFM